MNELSSYVFSPLREGDLAIYRGTGNGLAPILLVATEETSPGCVERLDHEYALKSELDADWAARPIARTHYNGGLALVLKDPGGAPLDRMLGQPLDVPHFLRIAIPLAGALRQVHERGLIHKDIKPANILVDAASGGVWLTGFGIASRLPRERQTPAPPEIIAGTLAYMAPEQTGRMNRSVDSRSDLYALGVTLYEMLTGTLPFTAADPMEWVHCHIARQPAPPDERVADIPGLLSAIVMKLLAKTGEQRYQTAAGIEADLRSGLADWESHGRMDAFPLGMHDAPDRLLIPEKLYGREPEIDALLASFNRVVTNGIFELVLVSGYSGIGKSSVVNELHKALVPRRGLFASGKFDQYKRDIPYATVGQAFRSLVRSLLTQSEEELGRWRNSLSEALGPNGQLMINLVPELELVIGKQPPVPDLRPQDAQNRFQMVFRRFLSVFACKEHPLALFLDDLQWMDAATLDLLEDLATQPDVRHLMLVGAYRDNEVSLSHPLLRTLEAIRKAGARVEEIVLAPLGFVDVGRLIADALHCEPERARSLAELVQEKTGGNPFFAIQFLTALAEEGLLTFDQVASAWRWDMNRIRVKAYTDNVVDFVVGKLKRLSDATQEALKQLACLGNVAEASTLAMVYGETEEAIHTMLWEAVHAGLVARENSAYRFLHDRIQQAAYSLISDEDRANVHLRIGRAMLSRTPTGELGEHLFNIANQFNRSAERLADRDEKAQVATIDLRAGRKAKASAAFASARAYFACGMALLGERDWGSRHELMFSLWLERAECEFLSGDFDKAEQLIVELLPHGTSKVECAAVYHLKILLHTVKSENAQAVASALAGLRLFDIDIPAHPTREQVQAEYEAAWQTLDDRPIESLIDLPLMTDPEQRAAMQVLSTLLGPAYFTDLHLFCLLVCRMVNVSTQHGMCGASAQAYGYWGIVLGPVFHRYREDYRFAKLACDLVEKHGFVAYRAKVHYAMGMVAFWTQPTGTAIDFLRAASRSAIETGDMAFACYSMHQSVTDLLLRNDPLDTVWRESEMGLDFVRKAKFRDVANIIVSQQRFIATMQRRTVTFSTFSDAQFDEAAFEALLTEDRVPIVICSYWILKIKARFLSGDYAEALASADKAKMLLWAVVVRSQLLDYFYYTAVTVAALYDTASVNERNSWRELLAAHRDQLREWADNNPLTFVDKYELVSAEIARLEGRDTDAMRLYEQAIRSAREHGFVQNEGTAHELAARFYATRGAESMAHFCLRNARHCYLRWGAFGKVRQLEQLHPHLRDNPILESPTATIGAHVERLDVGTVLKAAQAVSGEIVLDKLIETLLRIAVEHAGAERGLLILFPGDGPRIVAEATTGRGQVEVTLRETAVSSELPESMLHYVRRTRESVILDDALALNPFSADEYLARKRARSVLCLPLVKQSKLIGALYLENSLASHVFTPARISVLELLASQAAISLENARLYKDLAQREARIRRLVDANIIGVMIWSVDGQIVEANEAFLGMLGYSRDDLISGRLQRKDLTPAEWYDADDRALATLKATGSIQPREKEYFRKDGSRAPVLVGAATLEGGREEAVAFVLDMTDRKRAELERRQLASLVEQATETMAISDLEGGTPFYLNKAGLKIFGFDSLEEARTRRGIHYILPEDRQFMNTVIWPTVLEQGSWSGEIRLRHFKTGDPIPVLYSAFRIDDPKTGQPVNAGQIVSDITERKQAEEKLRISEQRFRDYAETASDWLWETGPDHRFTRISEPVDAVGIPPSQAVGLVRWEVARDVESEPEKWRLHREMLDTYQPFRDFVYSALNESGYPVYFRISGKPVFGAKGNFLGYRGTGTDITANIRADHAEEELRKAQMELAHLTRVTALGELTASIAHEVNQPLAGVVANAESGLSWLRRGTPDVDAACRSLEWIIDDGNRASEVIRRVRSLANKAGVEKLPLNVNDVAREVIALVQRELTAHRVSLRTEFAPALPMILGDRIQLQQVIINLMMNGSEAMQAVMDRPREMVIRSRQDEAQQVLLSVTDCGVGIPAENADRLFTAFFTTKSSGMGMGLSICRSIVEDHGGRLWATANVPHGATFQFALPVNADIAS